MAASVALEENGAYSPRHLWLNRTARSEMAERRWIKPAPSVGVCQTWRGTARSFALICAAIVGLNSWSVFSASADSDHQAETMAKAFLQTEAQEWIKTWLNQHPPVVGVDGFGGKAIFAVQLILAADAYFKSDTDKARFHAVLQGAAAFVAYSYSATPIVGIIVTVVYVIASIVESDIAGSYEESMLEIQADMIATQARLNDLIFRNGMARATRLLVLVDAAQKVGEESLHADALLAADCSARAGDYATLATCSERLIAAVSLRRLLVASIARLLKLPDTDLAMLAVSDDQHATTQADVERLGGEARKKLQESLKQASSRLQDIDKFYTKFQEAYDGIAAQLFVREALEDPSRLAALDEFTHQCLLDRTRLAIGASTTLAQLAEVRAGPKEASDVGAARLAARESVANASGLLSSWEQRKLSCPDIRDNPDLSHEMVLVRQSLASLPGP